jgi:hypothetical protein
MNAHQLYPRPLPVHSSVMDVTPELATEWLTNPLFRGANRHLNERTVDDYTAEMLAGRWKLTGEAIKFGTDGALQDGQHRLYAIVASGRTLRTLVVTNVASDAQDVMDSGRRRSAADVLAINGHTGNLTTCAAVCRLLVSLDSGTLTESSKSSRMSNVVIKDYMESHPEVALMVDRMGGAHRPVTNSVYGAALVLMSRVDLEATIEFNALFTDGVGLLAGNPILALRNRLLQGQSQRQRLLPYIQLSALLRAWNAWRSGQQMAKFSIYNNKDAAIPIPTVLK